LDKNIEIFAFKKDDGLTFFNAFDMQKYVLESFPSKVLETREKPLERLCL
jgi:hypothetical protein